MEISEKLTAKSRLEAAGRQHGEEFTSLMSLNQSDEEENNDIPEGDKSQSTDSQTDSEEIRQGVCCSGLYNIKVFLLLICLFSIIHGFAINGINNVNIPMYERRYHLTSTQSGLEASFYDISACFLVLIVGYVAPRYNQPRLIGAGLLVLSLGSLTMVLPHFLSGEYKPKDVPPAVCLIGQDNHTDSRCDEKDEKLSSYLYLLLLAQLLHGLSGVALYTLAPPYIDGSVSNKQSPLYMGIFYSSATLGPGIGYILGGYFLSLYVDIPKPPPQ